MDYMALALSLARKALGTTSPNPAVGAVIVKDGVIIGQGVTQKPGSDHAEIAALKGAGDDARGATMYVTLEPCCHYGRTSPCTKTIIASGIAEVHIATLDPNPLISCQGQAELEAAGIKTYLGDHDEEARQLNEAHFKFITTGLPFVAVKFAMSLDGKIATRTGDSRWITGEAARWYVQELRRTSDALMVGVNTVLADDPQLTVRGQERQPLRVVVDSRARTPTTAQIFSQPGKTLIATTPHANSRRLARLMRVGAEVLELPSHNGQVDLRALLVALGQRQITSLLVEGGGALLGSLFDQGLVDKVYAFIAPVIIGGEKATPAVGGHGVERVLAAKRLTKVSVERVGDDILIVGYPEKGSCSAAL